MRIDKGLEEERALVAFKIFGWDEKEGRWLDVHGNWKGDVDCYRPDERLDQAMALAEAMRQRGHSYQITAYSKNVNSVYRNQYCFMLKERPAMFVWEDTLEQAIFAVAIQLAEAMP